MDEWMVVCMGGWLDGWKMKQGYIEKTSSDIGLNGWMDEKLHMITQKNTRKNMNQTQVC